MHDFYAEYERYAQNSSNLLTTTRAAELAMRRCLSKRRAAEALEVYEMLCRCGLIGITTFSSPSSSSPSAAFDTSRRTADTSAASLDQLAQEALKHLPHRKCQYSVLSLLMAAEVGNSAFVNSVLVYPDDRREESSRRNASNRSDTPPSMLLPHLEDVSVAELARIRVHQRLHALHTTGQLQQPLGKEYCLVAMHELCADPSGVASTTSLTLSAASTASTQLCNEIEVGPLCALSRCVLEHPFTYATPSAAWAQRELLWEADMCGDRWSWTSTTTETTATSTARSVLEEALAPADAERLMHIDNFVCPYRALCRSSLEFLDTFVPHWDALFVRRVAETLVLPPEAHVIFPANYNRSRAAAAAAATRRGVAGGQDVLRSTTGWSKNAVCATSTWTDASVHQLFGPQDAAGSDVCVAHSSTSPVCRAEGIIKRRVHHDVVVPDAAYVLHRFHQIRQLARHREVIVTHAVFLELVAAASRTANPLRFHARRVLREIMYATTTAVTARAEKAVLTKARTAPRKHPRATCGFTLLGLQDELALLEHCPERFFLQAHAEANAPSSVSVVLVTKQLERMIAAHDRGEEFAVQSSTDADVADGGAASTTTISAQTAQLNVDSLVSHLLEGNVGDASLRPVPSSSSKRAEPLFKNRSGRHWARLPALVATTNDDTRAAAFELGLSMYPPAGVAP
ncbi:hypothetical protein ABB37_00337 [Leptomonas pyrrhocoris]|uniref:Uncharacterized protein n=1 Tax=Leptomonas pyrrhocoris TaxID=157538 RepID=A0A0M9GA50_LEPPY|nr:hypothetical protein ABB37_00337 [Leptomonas pyrrhocoris]KPA86070.1 hypothetical protein ABB37_00337 [Leptomonas pyrrhocoris]|eukprot:XP_015664509.1 hypothetical protein ABB37_00337 [Leptomonas pyrrhocoris]